MTGSAIGKNVKVQLWDDAGNSLANVTVNAVVSGSNTATFGSTVAVTNGTTYRISMWVTDGSYYLVNDASEATSALLEGMQILDSQMYSAGDAYPTSTAGGERYPINPTFA